MAKTQTPLSGVISLLLLTTTLSGLARADELSAIPEVTVTADRVEEPANSTGSDVTVIPGSRLEQLGPQGITEVLRDVPASRSRHIAAPALRPTVHLRGARRRPGARDDRRRSGRQRRGHRRLRSISATSLRSTSSASRSCAGRNRRSTVRTRCRASSTSSPRRASPASRRNGDDRGRQLRHDHRARLRLRRDRQLDLFARLFGHPFRQLSGLWLSRQPSDRDRRRRHAAAAAAGFRTHQQGRS